MTAIPFGGGGGMPERILAACEITRRNRNVFSIGSFGTRVNFYAQQIRALNLVWALHSEGYLAKRERYAVIGAGVTGLMAAAALISHGCFVDVYETGGAPVPKQSETQHRFVHPTINSWPFKTPDLTTELPFLEWHVGQCDLIANSLRDQFQKIKTPESEILAGTTAEGIYEIAKEKVLVQSTLSKNRAYRLVILAVGFGDETPSPKLPAIPYWTADSLEGERLRRVFKDYIVSGCGDGGLIDALRVVHFDFRKGMLAFETAAELYGTPLASLIERAEQDVVAAGAGANRLEAAKKLRDAYERAADLLFEDPSYRLLQEKLINSLDSYHRILFLTDTVWDPPCSPAAAPIHKLMVAHAKQAGKIAFLSGEVRVEPAEYVVRGKHFKDKAKTKIIPRHGADPRTALEAILEDHEVDDLIAKQPARADLLADRHWSDPFPAVAGYPIQEFSSEAFIKSRMPMVISMVRTLDPHAEVTRMVGGYEVAFKDNVPTIVQGKFFGISAETSTYPSPTPVA